MSLIKGQLEEVWSALRAAANRRRSALQAVRIRNLRGIGDLRETAAGRFPMARFHLELREQVEAWRRRR